MSKVAVIVSVVFVLALLAMCMRGPSNEVMVRQECRYAVSVAAVNVDAWRYIDGQCSEAEQQTMLREMRRNGLSTDQIDKSRRAHGRSIDIE